MLGRWLRRSPDNRLTQARALADAGEPAKAAAIWRELADAGSARAMTNLGACYANGLGVAADADAARRWLQQGAEAGDRLGQRNLGTLLLATDPVAAAGWYRRAAEADDVASQEQLSRLLAEGPEAGWAEARRWAERAAQAGTVEAANRLATLYHEAKGGARDPERAAYWWRVAAEAGHGDAAAMLGAALHMGQGIAADQVEAMVWLRVGSARFSTLVRGFYATVEQQQLTPEQRADAERLAGERLAAHPAP